MRYMFLICACLVLAASLILGNYYYSGREFKGALPQTTDVYETMSWKLLAMQAGLLVAGIAFGHFYRRFQQLKDAGVEVVDLRTELRTFVRSTNFLLAMTAAPIVYGGVIAASAGAPVFTSLVLAFQNGFFWQAVMPTRPTVQGVTPKPADMPDVPRTETAQSTDSTTSNAPSAPGHSQASGGKNRDR